MGAPIINPEPQFCDQNGKPYAAGTIYTYEQGTTTYKPTYTDPALTALNPQPIVLNAAGRCTMWGDGDFRLILRDALGNLIWDQPATTIVSAAMEPVVSAPTIPDALNLLGVSGLIAAEATARSNADSAEQSARIAGDNTLQANIDAEATARFNADSTLYTEFTNADTALQNQINALPPPTTGAVTMQHGTGTTDSSGNLSVVFPAAFTQRVMDFQATADDTSTFHFTGYVAALTPPNGGLTNSAAVGQLVAGSAAPTPGPCASAAFHWWALGV
jgi:hypothetical protein